MLFKLTAGRLAPAHPPLAHSNFASRVDGKFAYARELQTSSEIKMKMKMKIKRGSDEKVTEDRIFFGFGRFNPRWRR